MADYKDLIIVFAVGLFIGYLLRGAAQPATTATLSLEEVRRVRERFGRRRKS